MSLHTLAARHAFLAIVAGMTELTFLFSVHPGGCGQIFLYLCIVGTAGFLVGYHARRFVDLGAELDKDEGEDNQ